MDGWKPFQCFNVQWKTVDSNPCNSINPEEFAPKEVFKQSMLNSDLIPILMSDKRIQKAHSIFKRVARGFIVFRNTTLYFISLHRLFTNEAHSIWTPTKIPSEPVSGLVESPYSLRQSCGPPRLLSCPSAQSVISMGVSNTSPFQTQKPINFTYPSIISGIS